MSNALTVYEQLENRIKKGDLDALLARWEFGRKLLEEQGDAGRLPNGRREQLSNALDISGSEIDNRKQFAEQYSTEATAEAAFKYHGSWYAICMWGLGKRGQPGDEFTDDWDEERERRALYDAAMALMRMADRRQTLLGYPTVERLRDAFIAARDRLSWGITALDCRIEDPTTPLSVDDHGHVLYAEEGEPLVRLWFHERVDEAERARLTTRAIKLGIHLPPQSWEEHIAPNVVR
jgi:hypothetical protein